MILLVLFVIIPLLIAVRGWLVMVGIGMLHGVFPAIPTVSYGQGIIVGIALALIFSLTVSADTASRS